MNGTPKSNHSCRITSQAPLILISRQGTQRPLHCGESDNLMNQLSNSIGSREHLQETIRSTRHLRTLKASHLRTLQTSHPRTEKPRHPRTKSGHPRTLMLGTSHFGLGWGGVGWDDNVHVPMHTQAQQPHHLSSRRAETGTALS
jgi:hypothetical protein